MASSGDAEYSSTVAEESDHSFICTPCGVDGHKLKAVGYCVNCKEYLCRRCYDCHLIPTPSRKHTLLGEDRMKEIKTNSNSICPEHDDRQLEYHCPTHSFFGCHMCFFKHQKSCKDVQYIPEVSETITDADEYKLFKERLTNILTKCEMFATDVKVQTDITATRHTEAVTAIKEFKREIVDAVVAKEKELLEKADTVKQEETAKMTEVVDKCKEILQEAQSIASTVEFLQNKEQNRDLYLTMIQSKDSLLSLENGLEAAGTNINSRRVAFSTNNDLFEILKSPFGLGNLHQTETITKVEHVQDINIKAMDDATTCTPVCSVLLHKQQLVIADKKNSKVKIMNTRQNKLISELKMSGRPYGVCQITDEQVAVTLPSEKKIALVRTSPSLSLDRTISVDGRCLGVGYSDGKLVVSFDSKKVEVLDMQGTILKTIETDETGKALFNNPYQLTVSPESKLIYVSNYSSHNVVCLKFDGTMMARYEDQELKGPWQSEISRTGASFLVGRDSYNIHQITRDYKKVKVLLTTADGLVSPECVSYCEREDKLYIGMCNNNNLKVFKVTYASL